MLGWLGALCFGLSALPQAYRSWRTGHATGLSFYFLLLWTLGEIFTTIAVIIDAPIGYLLANYGINAIFPVIIWRYWLWPRKS